MKKDSYYFPHYSDARQDRKLRRVIKDLGIEGYGIFFMILEILRGQPDFKYPLKDIDLLVDEIRASEVKVNAVISSYDLFTIDENNNFFSPKQIFYLQPYLEKSKRAREAAQKRWSSIESKRISNANADANASPNADANCNADQNASIVEYSIVENRKEKNNKYSSETFQERFDSFRESVLSYRSTYSDDMLKSFFDYWTEKSQKGYKMKFEKEKTWELSKRLQRWSSNNFGNKGSKESINLMCDF
jgi:hypothetical protein